MQRILVAVFNGRSFQLNTERLVERNVAPSQHEEARLNDASSGESLM